MFRSISVAALMLALVLTSCASNADPISKAVASTDTTASRSAIEDNPTVGPVETVADDPVEEPAAMVTTTILDAELQSAITELIGITEDLRELDFVRPPVITVVSPEELASRVRTIIDEELDPNETARDQALLASLGVLDADTDLGELYLALYAEQVQGYYDGDTEELVVPSSGDELDVLDKMVLVHELTHALTDQNFGFHDELDQLIEDHDYERSAALRALVEGDATYTQALYFWQLPKADQTRGMELIEAGAGQALATTPSYIVDVLQFPYNEGARFATSLGTSGGFSELNDAYLNPPTTTEQIYDQDRFERREPALEVLIPVVDVEGYDMSDQGVWGRAGLEALFEPSLGRGARLAAEGWGGDWYQVYWNGTETVFVMSVIGDSPYETDELYDGWSAFIDAQVPSSASATVGWVDGHVAVVVSPDQVAMSTLVRALGVQTG
ncbi:MAG: hypothetical protein JJE47_17630, partial [Acidimicrobiia bacterium]|nr:hypothetical protein [Acidimicrobiia bacterium]